MSEATLRNAFDRFPRSTRERLERLSQGLDGPGAEDFPTFATSSRDPASRARAIESAEAALGMGTRRSAILEVVQAFRDWALRCYSRYLDRRMPQALVGLGNPAVGDRIAFLASLEPAIVAIILWHELGDADRGELVGPWATFLDPLDDR